MPIIMYETAFSVSEMIRGGYHETIIIDTCSRRPACMICRMHVPPLLHSWQIYWHIFVRNAIINKQKSYTLSINLSEVTTVLCLYYLGQCSVLLVSLSCPTAFSFAF